MAQNRDWIIRDRLKVEEPSFVDIRACMKECSTAYRCLARWKRVG